MLAPFMCTEPELIRVRENRVNDKLLPTRNERPSPFPSPYPNLHHWRGLRDALDP